MFEIMLNLEKEYNKERDEEDMTHICFSCHKEGHITHNYFLVFSHKKKQNFKKIGAMLAASNRVERKKEKSSQFCSNCGSK
jgi:hypothetical protein